MVITIRINKSESDLEIALSMIPNNQRAQLFKLAYKQYLQKKDIHNIEKLIIEDKDISMKILKLITAANKSAAIQENSEPVNIIATVQENSVYVDMRVPLKTKEEVIKAKQQVLVKSMHNFGASFNMNARGKNK